MFRQLSNEVSLRAQKRQLVSNSISITLKYTREKSRTKQMILDHYTNDFETIYASALLLFENIYQGEMLRLVGVSLNNVIHQNKLNEQISLFDPKQESTKKQVNSTDQIIHQLNETLPGIKVMKASSLIKEETIQKKYLKNNE